mmetsp:Transcript_22972/g.63723  ORF Transcript_22972/g.63723 Transcript_22972/m.63723 type:complete len:374 (-) Transcript_22972:2341-3462(-)
MSPGKVDFIRAVAIALLLVVCTHDADGFSVRNVRGARTLVDSALFSSDTTASLEDGTKTSEATSESLPQRKVALLLCPAQFCVPDDYSDLWETLPSQIEITEGDDDATSTRTVVVDKVLSRVVPLSRRDWIKVAKQLPTQDFVDANLRVHKTLDWYFAAIDQGLKDIIDGGSDIDGICLVGHSIGGWVARAYLGGLSRSSTAVSRIVRETNMVSSFITLGTPHVSPDTALVDQTRGLLREIAETPACSSGTLVNEQGIEITCVCSSSLSGNFFTTNVEEFVAASSYLPLLGKTDGSVKGDGIVPLELAFMEEPARKVVLPECPTTGRPIRHSHVLPTPWNLWDASAKSIVLDDTEATSYTAPEIVEQWARFIR